IRNTQQFQCALQRTVFTMSAMQGNEYTIEASLSQIGQTLTPCIKQVSIHTYAAQSLMHTGSGLQRYLTLTGEPAVQHPYAAIIHTHTSSPIRVATRLIEPAPIRTTTSPS